MKITNIRITRIEGDTDVLESDYMPLIMGMVRKTLEPMIEQVIRDGDLR